jgi:hypothetical protein
MKMNHLFYNSLKTVAVFCCALMLTAGFAACSDSNDDNNSDTEPGKEEEPITYDDLSYFQNSIIEVDDAGNKVCQYIGEALFENEPLHLYVGVDNFEEAEEMFRQWIAPDVTLGTAAPLIAELTDNEGKAKGSVTFAKGTENGAVAEVTASTGIQLKHFNQITFLLNDAWPHNAAAKPRHRVGDIIRASLTGVDARFLKDNDYILDWMCIQAEKNGVPPIFIAVTRNAYDRGHYGIPNTRVQCKELKKSKFCPGMERAKSISDILKKRWNYFCTIYDKVGCGKLSNDGFWINHSHGTFFNYDDYMFYSSGVTYGANDSSFSSDDDKKLPFLFKIDWMKDNEVTAMLIPTAGTDIPNHNEPYMNLFDNNINTKWYVQAAQKQNGVWFVEFNGNYASSPKGYKLYTGNDTSTYPHRNPVAWKLYGKTYETDQWTLMDERDTEKTPSDALPTGNGVDKAYTFKDVKPYRFYRLEISKSKGDSDMQLSRFLFTY